MTSLANLQTQLKLLSEPVRLRLLALLSMQELAVQELVTITGLAQSRVSNHLSLLRRSGLVIDRKEGTWSFYRLAPAEERDGALSADLFGAVLRPYLESPEGRRDAEAVERAREQRRERSRLAHDALAARWVEMGQEFRFGSLLPEAFSALAPRQLTVADLGCGAGFLTGYLGSRAARVIAVDHSQRMLNAAAERTASEQVEFRRGEFDALPIDDGEVDAAFANLVWHHLADMDRAAAEIARILRPGGVAVITDLAPHHEEWMREEMGDLHLGLRADEVARALTAAGLGDVAVESLHDEYVVQRPGDGGSIGLPMFLVRGRLPETNP